MHGKTRLTCCADMRAASRRLKVIVVRNPFSKVVSSFLHHSNKKWRSRQFDTRALYNFSKWFDEQMTLYPLDNLDHGNHFKTQAGHFFDWRLEKPYNPTDFFVVHLETLEQDWHILERVLRRCYGYKLPMPKMPKTNSHQHDLSTTRHFSILRSEPALLKRLADKYEVDFKFFGYDKDARWIEPVLKQNFITDA